MSYITDPSTEISKTIRIDCQECTLAFADKEAYTEHMRSTHKKTHVTVVLENPWNAVLVEWQVVSQGVGFYKRIQSSPNSYDDYNEACTDGAAMAQKLGVEFIK